jgi:hypothetical protein
MLEARAYTLPPPGIVCRPSMSSPRDDRRGWVRRGSRSPTPWERLFPEEDTRLFSPHLLSTRLVSQALLT